MPHPTNMPSVMAAVVGKPMMIPCPTYESEGENLKAWAGDQRTLRSEKGQSWPPLTTRANQTRGCRQRCQRPASRR